MNMVSLILLEKCNLKCDYCFANKTNLSSKLNLKSIQQFIEKYQSNLGKIDIAVLTGGEPLLYDQIVELISFLRKDISNIVLLTNGILLTDDLLSFFSANNIQLAISLDSINSDYHERMRGKQKEILTMLNHIAEKYQEITVTLNVTVSPENIEEIPAIDQYAKQKNFKVEYGLIDVDSNKSYSWNCSSVEQKKRYIDMMKQYGKYSNVELEFIRKVLMGENHKAVSCFFANHNIVINPKGEVTNCFKSKGSIIGNINENVDDIIERLKRTSKIIGSCLRIGCLSEFLGK